jgi:Transposase DDE domain
MPPQSSRTRSAGRPSYLERCRPQARFSIGSGQRKGAVTTRLLAPVRDQALRGGQALAPAAIPTWTRTAALIAEHRALADTLGGTPSHWACYRFCRKLREHSDKLADCLDSITSALRAERPEYGVDVAIDASDLTAYANGQRFLSKNGPERERFSDPDASWGNRSAVSTRKGGGFYGYRVHAAVCARTGLPLAAIVRSAREHESLFVAALLDTLRRRGFVPETAALDMGYDKFPPLPPPSQKTKGPLLQAFPRWS